MKKKVNKKQYFFVDESGDPYFYNRNSKLIVGKDGCSKLLILGMIKAEEPELLRNSIRELQDEIKNDEYLQKIPSVKKSVVVFHATDDCPEVREKVFKKLIDLPFKSEFVVARKKEEVFISRHRKSPNLFYDDLITKLFQNQLHQSSENTIYFAARGNRARQAPFEEAIRKAIFVFENKWKTKIDSEVKIFSQRPVGEPCLQIIDYMNWAVQRAFIQGEPRYIDFIKAKISLIVDLYDFNKYPRNFYSRKNPFEINKISPL